MKAKYAFLLLALALIIGTACSLDAQAQQVESFVAKTTVSDDAVTFQPQGTYVGFTMQVAGPNEFFYEKSFTGDEVPSLHHDAARMADGPYQIRVTAQPILDKALRAKLEEARANGDQAQMKKLFDEAGLLRRSMVHAVSIGIADGKFIDPTLVEQPAENLGANTPVETSYDLGTLTPMQLSRVVLDGTLPASGPAIEAATTTATASSVQGALLPADVLPASLAPYVNTEARWFKAHMQNVMADGSTQLLEAYMSPVEYNGLQEGSLFKSYFRVAAQDGTGAGTWFQGYFQSTGDTFVLLDDNQVDLPEDTTTPALFDYMTQTEEEQASAANAPRRATVLATNDGVIRSSLCVGIDCSSSPVFGFDTLRLKENNLRIKFEDTSNSGSFPSRDWQLTANDSNNGGQNKFSIDDIDGGRTPFTIEANAPSHSLYVDDGGRVGLGTMAPVVEAHIVDGDSPAVRLQQDGSSGFTPHTWDMAGNEVNFFIRDLTNSSALPFRILDGSGDDVLVLGNNSNVGLGTDNPNETLHIKRTGADDAILKIETATGLPRILLVNSESNGATCPSGGACNWFFDVSDNEDFRISVDGSGQQELVLTEQGDLTVTGNIVSGGAGTCNPGPCDGTFKSDFEVPTIEEHAAFMWQNSYLWGVGPTTEGAPINLSQKTTGILHELEVAHIYIEQLNEALQAKTSEIDSLNERLTRLERLLEAQDQ